MKRIIGFFTFSLIFSFSIQVFAKESEIAVEKDLYEYNNIIANINESSSPQVLDNFIVFTYPKGPRFVGIAFDFENFKTIHHYEKHVLRDVDETVRNEIFFYLLEKPKNLDEIKYRLVIDGIWTEDFENNLKKYDEKSGLTLSYVELKNNHIDITNSKEQNGVKFVYKGESGLQIRLGGTFTSWDSWIYELNETKPGFYELTIPLPTGKYYYNYFIGMERFVDKTNPDRAYTNEGRAVSVITVN